MSHDATVSGGEELPVSAFRWSARYITQDEAENEPPGWSVGWHVIGEEGSDPDPLVRERFVLHVDLAHDGDGGECDQWLAERVADALNRLRGGDTR